MKLNCMKCKQMPVCFLWEPPKLSRAHPGDSTDSESSGYHNKLFKMEQSYKLGGF